MIVDTDGMRRLEGISSMATRQLLIERVAAFNAAGGPASMTMTAVGGVDAARRVREGEPFDVVVLAADAIDRLAAEGCLADGLRIDWARSGVAVAVSAGAAHPDLTDEAAVRRAVMAAGRIGYSTGPSGVALAALFTRWGIAAEIAAKTVQPPPGTPVASLLARGAVDLGFQQLSELMDVDGVEVVGPLPVAIQVITTFSAAVCRTSTQPAEAGRFLRHLADPSTAGSVRRHGMTLI